MIFIDNDVWIIEVISKKRKQEFIKFASVDEERMSEAAIINEVVMNAMTPDAS